VVLNASARALHARSPMRRAIERAAARGGAELHATTTLAELEQVARAIAEKGPRAVVVAGGDGSHMNALSALARAWPTGVELPAFALAPGGTMNTVARNLGMLRPSPESAARLVGAVCADQARSRVTATLRVTDESAGDRVGFIFGSALVARFFDLYYRGATGPAGAARILAKVFAGSFAGSATAHFVLDPEAATLRVDGVEHPSARWSLLLASVVPDLGLHVRATFRAGSRTDRFHVVASGLHPRALAAQLPRALAGKPLGGDPHVDALAKEMEVRFERDDAAYVLDGDVVRATAVRVAVGPVVTVMT
jgi:diacylglycerol kinase (ATP)